MPKQLAVFFVEVDLEALFDIGCHYNPVTLIAACTSGKAEGSISEDIHAGEPV